jgi:voltage-gated potassium channel
MDKNNKIKITAALSALIILIVIGTFCYHFLEHWSFITSLYFVVATLSTVGYGDVHPTNDITRLFTIFFILFGVGIAAAAITTIGSRYIAKREIKVANRISRRKKK